LKTNLINIINMKYYFIYILCLNFNINYITSIIKKKKYIYKNNIQQIKTTKTTIQ